MPMIDESWEYWVADSEVADVLNEHNERVVRAAKSGTHRDDNDFFFAFAGNNDFDTGRFYDGIKFGKSVGKDWFTWNLVAKQHDEQHIVSLFERAVADFDRANRADFLARNFVSAWGKLPPVLAETMTALLTMAPRPKIEGTCGRPPSVSSAVAERLGTSHNEINRRYRRAQLSFLAECIPNEHRHKCGCGCGMPTPIAYVQNGVFGHTVGKAISFITGHNGRNRAATPPVLNSVKLIVPEEKAGPVARVDRCPHCGLRHMTTCPRIRSIEYFESGQVKRVELHDRQAAKNAM